MDEQAGNDDGFRPIPPPPPCEQVVARSSEASDAGFAAAAAPSSGERCASPGAAGVPDAGRTEPQGRTAQGAARAKNRRAVGAVAAAMAVVAGIGIAVAAFSAATTQQVDDERAIDRNAAKAAAQTEGEDRSQEASDAQTALSAQLFALAANEDASLEAYVLQFMADYDAGTDSSSYGFADLGISAEELTEKLCDGLSFEVVSVDVYGSKAWVDVSVTSKSFSDQADAFAAAMNGADREYEDADAYKAALKEALLGAFDTVKPRSSDMLVVVNRGDDGWAFTSDDVASLLGSAWYG